MEENISGSDANLRVSNELSAMASNLARLASRMNKAPATPPVSVPGNGNGVKAKASKPKVRTRAPSIPPMTGRRKLRRVRAWYSLATGDKDGIMNTPVRDDEALRPAEALLAAVEVLAKLHRDPCPDGGIAHTISVSPCFLSADGMDTGPIDVTDEIGRTATRALRDLRRLQDVLGIEV